MALLAAGLISLAVAIFHGVYVLRKLWNDPRYADKMVISFSRLPYSPAVHRGAVRASLLLTAMAATISVFFFAAAVSDLQGNEGRDAGSLVALIALFLFLACFATHLSIIWFNFPRQLALPSMREDTGMVIAAFRRRFSSAKGR
ncbi:MULTISPECIES: hypothetical protein [unclassified Streptomyces]|uniref:hypothetical protein n=1 Tax=unclassified Streptomyces TaxID=2593676 RepID=UPI002E28757F|nr:hypothetical protein [Streptomyces sp. NBC_00223]